MKEIAREAGREEEAEEEIELGGVQASVGEVGAEDDNAVEERAEQGSGHQCRRRAREGRLPYLPPVPQFNSFVHTTAWHEQHARYPIGFDVNGGALAFFKLFFDTTVFEQLSENTNLYVNFKHAGDLGYRRWIPISAAELRIFLGITIYMGVFPSAQVSGYWRHDSSFPFHRIALYISQNRFEQLKRYFHISPPYNSLPRSRWYQKFHPLASILSARFQNYLLPASDAVVDDLMIRFTGRSAHTTQIRGKTIPRGYNVLALCDHGYTYSFLFTRNTESFAELNSDLYSGPLRLSSTSRAIYQLAASLPSDQFSFTIYMDYYFTNIPLLTALRQRKIGACGTVRSTSVEYPPVLKFGKNKKPTFPWNTISGVVCREVLVWIWQDNNLVQFMSTVHQITNQRSNYTLKKNHRPCVTNANCENVEAFFDYQAIGTFVFHSYLSP